MTPLEALVALYALAADRLRSQIESAASGGSLALAGRLASARRTLAELAAASDVLAERAVLDSYLRAAREVDAVAQHTELGDLVGTLTGTHRRAILVVANELSGRLERAQLLVGRRTEDAFRRIGLEQTGIGLVAGAGRKQVARAIARELARDGATGYLDTRGRRWQLDHYATMVARTTTRAAASAATDARMEEHGLDLVTISSHEHPRDICTPFDGKTFSRSGRSRRWPKLE